jgi:hypothetical protein
VHGARLSLSPPTILPLCSQRSKAHRCESLSDVPLEGQQRRMCFLVRKPHCKRRRVWTVQINKSRGELPETLIPVYSTAKRGNQSGNFGGGCYAIMYCSLGGTESWRYSLWPLVLMSTKNKKCEKILLACAAYC